MSALNIDDRVYCIHGPVDSEIAGTVVEDNGLNKVLVVFDNGDTDWCKYEWLEKI